MLQLHMYVLYEDLPYDPNWLNYMPIWIMKEMKEILNSFASSDDSTISKTLLHCISA